MSLGAVAKQSYVTETISMLRVRHMQTLPPDGLFPCHHHNHINFKNGIYDIRSRELTPHTPEFKSILQVPTTYDPEAKCPEIDAFLEDVLQGNTEDIALAHELIGVSLLQQIPIAKLWVLVGPTHRKVYVS